MSDATATTEKNRQVATTISPDLHQRLDNYRWEQRIDKFSDLQRIALEEFAENHDL